MKKNQINDRIKMLREHLMMTQQQFVEKCGLTITSLSRIENNEVEPQNKTVKKIIDNTGINPAWLVEGKGEIAFNEVIPNVNTNTTESIYKDALYVELKQQATIWQEKYNELFQMFGRVLDRGNGNMGKHKSLELAGRLNKASFQSQYVN